jgi:hypothetical protein
MGCTERAVYRTFERVKEWLRWRASDQDGELAVSE